MPERYYCPNCSHSGTPAGAQRPPLCGACAARSGGRESVAMLLMPAPVRPEEKAECRQPVAGQAADDLRAHVALFLADYGPRSTGMLWRLLDIPTRQVEEALTAHPWFYRSRTDYRWHLTPEGEMWVRLHREKAAIAPDEERAVP